ncbi:class II aldolase/adducin family protein [Candidatus Woesearchaeota archaeon]|nr:class II aldolase/adducin family protein [Candidatus Woesearchaeota archaeon]
MDEGYIKFKIEHIDKEFKHHTHLEELNDVRTRLHKLGLIGMYDDGIGYGNISMRIKGSDQFITTGTATGNFEILNEEQYCEVTSFDIEMNIVHCTGKIEASSESMTHGAVYLANKKIGCVIHIHHLGLWEYMLKEGYPKTPKKAEYGTPEIALASKEVVEKIGLEAGIFVMEGHKEGIVAYGPDLKSAEKTLMDEIKNSHLLIL